MLGQTDQTYMVGIASAYLATSFRRLKFTSQRSKRYSDNSFVVASE